MTVADERAAELDRRIERLETCARMVCGVLVPTSGMVVDSRLAAFLQRLSDEVEAIEAEAGIV